VVHHVRAHHGDRVLFFDKQNLACLSKPCHDALTARTRGGAR
jgi:5-methylcytosine-specific restriction protein A